MKFEWDPDKNELNKTKHSISFEIAKSVFLDKHAVYLYEFIQAARIDLL